MKILFTFPGQGTQHEGMLQNLPGTELAQAREVLGAEVDTLDSAASLTIPVRFSFPCSLLASHGRASWSDVTCRLTSSAVYRLVLIPRR
ncbi:acyl transferase domain-containing protein [Enterobacter cloacae]|uniref:Acyl transferase domain-containing protein n=1 Tax=Enterobacter cloacae TaxID=550 RepID=A0A377LRL8_ENTCL|nr:acyl transferase domain-containing protein [Enterobacter cloacae]